MVSLGPQMSPALVKNHNQQNTDSASASTSVSSSTFSLVGDSTADPSGPVSVPSSLVSIFKELQSCLRQLLSSLAARTLEFLRPDRYLTYKEAPASILSATQLERVPRKTLILDLDETLIHSCYIDPETKEDVGGSLIPPTAVPDYQLQLTIDGIEAVKFRVFKRPHVDEFLDNVAKWYDVVIYTASIEAYAARVVDLLDGGRGILRRRFYRQHCRSHTTTMVSKDLTLVNKDLSRTFIIDNTPNAYRDFPHNAIPIKSYIYDPHDTELLKLLPFLDALRFTKDVRSILRRRVDYE